MEETNEERCLAAYVGQNADYYVAKWAPLLARDRSRAGFNWAAFLLTTLWLPYRKMYRLTAIVYAALLAEALIERLTTVAVFRVSETPFGLDTVVTIATSVVIGAYGNAWYLAHARQQIAAARLQTDGDANLVERLRRRGGTSAVGALVAFLVGFAVLTIASVAGYPG